jgi:hypothetical protein
MNRNQEAFRSMCFKVQEFVQNTDPALRAIMPTFNTTYALFENDLQELSEASKGQIVNRTGKTIEKINAKKDLIQKASNVSHKIRAYASDHNEMFLFHSCNKTVRGMSRLRQTLVTDYCQRIHNLATERLPQLAPYLVTPDELTALQTAINTYQTILPKPQALIDERKYLTQRIEELLSDLSKKLKKLDLQVLILKGSHPEWVTQFKLSRKIVQLGSRKTALKGTITDPNQKPLSNAEIHFPLLNSTRTSNQNGSFVFKSLPAGVHPIIIKRVGYQTLTTTVVIIQNEHQELKTQLTPLSSISEAS